MPLAMGEHEIQAEISHFSILAGDPCLLTCPECYRLWAWEPPAMKIFLSPFWAHSSLHPQKEPWPGHRHGETETQSGTGLHLRSTQGSTAKAVSCVLHTSISPLPAPFTHHPTGHGRKLAPGSPCCKTYLERSGGP